MRLASHKISRATWVYWITLAIICGQLWIWISGAAQLLQSLKPLLGFVTPADLLKATFEKMGALRFTQFYIFGIVNILIYLALALLLLLAKLSAMTVFLASVGVMTVQQLLDLVLLFPDGSTRDWVTTIVGNLGLAIYLGLLYLAFRNLFASDVTNAVHGASMVAEPD